MNTLTMLGAALLLSTVPTAVQAVPFNALMLTIDISYSIVDADFKEMIDAYTSVMDSSLSNFYGQLAVGVSVFGRTSKIHLPMTDLNNMTDVETVKQSLQGLLDPKLPGGFTSSYYATSYERGGANPGGTRIDIATITASVHMQQNGYDKAQNAVIDVSTDGEGQGVWATATYRAAARAAAQANIGVNCIAIAGGDCSWIYAPVGKTYISPSYAQFGATLTTKIIEEVTPPPTVVPATPTFSAPWKQVKQGGLAGQRTIVTLKNGDLFGPIVTCVVNNDDGGGCESAIVFMRSSDHGVTWQMQPGGQIGPKAGTHFANGGLLSIPGTDVVYFAYREENAAKQGWIVLSTSTDGGATFTEFREVTKRSSLYIGAPTLFMNKMRRLQVYYDDEHGPSDPSPHPLNNSPKPSGCAVNHQWISMIEIGTVAGDGRIPQVALNGFYAGKGRRHVLPSDYFLNHYHDWCATKPLRRDGTPSVVYIKDDAFPDTGRVMTVMQGIQPELTNNVHTIQSFDGGYTWAHFIDAYCPIKNGRYFNAYNPYAVVEGENGIGPVLIAFCTDVEWAAPQLGSTAVEDRHCHVKTVQTTHNYETWGGPTVAYPSSLQTHVHKPRYHVGLFRHAGATMLTLDLFGGNYAVATNGHVPNPEPTDSPTPEPTAAPTSEPTDDFLPQK